MLPPYWIDFLNANDLRGKDCRLSEGEDESAVGADMTVFTEEQSIDEETNFYPGIAVVSDGYVPVASCISGSGDPYFIKTSEGPRGRLYRIYHDAVSQNGYKAEDAIVVVLQNYELLLKHVEL